MKSLIVNIARWFYKRFFFEETTIKYRHGAHFYSNTHIDTLNPQFVDIGDNFMSAPGSLITAHDASTFLFCRKYRIEKVIIGDNVFLGANSVVMPGVKIGHNVIIGAGAVVTKNVPSNSVYAGNPAKYICSVEEYIEKCKARNVLYDVPESFLNEYESDVLHTRKSIEEYQEMTLRESLRRIKNE
jgi:acetyltransferase-like isoleucine patch superfamily enzyme